MKTRKSFKHYLPYYVLGLPGIIYLIINNYMPFYGLQIAFKNFNYRKGISGSPWCGFDNFKFLFATDNAWVITRNTVVYNICWLFLGNFVAVFLAIFLNEVRSKSAKKVYQSLIMLPYLISTVIVAYLVYAFLSPENGMINAILKTFGLQPIQWYMKKEYWPFILTIVFLWMRIGFSTVIYLSTIVGFGKEYYEAASLDGAGKWKQVKTITIPMLKPVIIMMLTLGMGQVFRSDFGLFYQVPRNQGLLYPVTDTIDTFIFRALMKTGDVGMSSAAAFYQSVVCFVTIMIFNAIVRKISKEDAIF